MTILGSLWAHLNARRDMKRAERQHPANSEQARTSHLLYQRTPYVPPARPVPADNTMQNVLMAGLVIHALTPPSVACDPPTTPYSGGSSSSYDSGSSSSYDSGSSSGGGSGE